MSEYMHRGQKVQSIAAAVHARLANCLQDCRIRERLNDDHARYDVTPRRSEALGFVIEIAPGGINLSTPICRMSDLALEQDAFAIDLVEAILEGRVREVTRLDASGRVIASKTIFRGRNGRTLFKSRRSSGLIAQFFARKGKAARRQFSPYRG